MSNTTMAITVDMLNKMKPTDIVKSDAVKSRFIEIRSMLWRDEDAEGVYEKEYRYFNQLLADNSYLLEKATHFSIFSAFIDLAVCGLSLEPGAKAQCYLMTRNTKTGTYTGNDGKQYNNYETRCVLTISGYGELVQRQRCGQIRYADNPVVVYEEDDFSFSDKDGRKSVSYTCRLPHKSDHIIAAFMRITRNDGSLDYAVMFEEDWLRLMEYSSKNNSRFNKETRQWEGQANELYGNPASGKGIDSSFLCAKLIKHAFKTYPKLRLGKATELQTERADEPQTDDYYGVDDVQDSAKPSEPADFCQADNFSAGVQVNDETDGAF